MPRLDAASRPRPPHLRAWYDLEMETAPKLFLRQLQLGSMDNFVYLLGAAGSKETAVVDPAWDSAAIDQALADAARTLACVLLTHSHPDHVNALAEVLGRHPVPVYAQAAEVAAAPWMEKLGPALHRAAPDQVVQVGPLAVRLIATPGHTPGSQCLLAEGALFTGDTLFVNACGRVDLPGGSAEAMFHSLSALARLPPETQVYPGHDYGDVPVSTVARERERNPYLQPKNLGAFAAIR